MRYALILALALGALTSFAGCGDDAAMLAPELFGSWEQLSLEADGMSTDCPGAIDFTDDSGNRVRIICGAIITFNADGTFVGMLTTDEFGGLYPWRWEGTWSTQGSTVTTTTTKSGPDANNLLPVDPPLDWEGTWSVSGDTLVWSWTEHGTEQELQLTASYNRTTHKDEDAAAIAGDS